MSTQTRNSSLAIDDLVSTGVEKAKPPESSAAEVKPLLVQTFMTHRMSDAAILQLCTGREREIATLRDALCRSLQAVPGALQHVVIYAPRGFGKSFMARLAQIEANKLAISDAPIPFVLLPEEQHNLTRNPHALLDYIAQRLADLRTGEDHSWVGSMFQWPDPEAETRKWNEAAARLEAELDQCLPNGKGMVVVAIENFDVLLFSVFKAGPTEQRLRKWLDRQNNRLMLIATATGTVDMDYDRPLFQAFQPLRLAPWDSETCMEYFERRRAAELRAPLDHLSRPKARAVADFIGGNPRLAQLLADVLDTDDALSVANIMDALADKLADYYRRRIDDLPGMAQGLLDALIRGGEPASQTELARRVGAGSQADIARVMQELQRSDIIRGVPALDSRETLYRVTDRVFVHFYRVRQGQQQALRTPLASILDFLKAYYSRDEQRGQAMLALEKGQLPEARLFADLAREQGSEMFSFSAGFQWRLQRALKLAGESAPWPIEELNKDLLREPEVLYDKSKKWQAGTPSCNAAKAMLEAQTLAKLGLIAESDAALSSAIGDMTDRDARVLLLYERAVLRGNRKKNSLATADFAALSKINVMGAPDEIQWLTLDAKTKLAYEKGNFQKALQLANRAVQMALASRDDAGRSESMRNIVLSNLLLKRTEDAMSAALSAIDFAKLSSDKSELPTLMVLALAVAQVFPSRPVLVSYLDVIQNQNLGASESEPNCVLFFGVFMSALTRAMAWDVLDDVLADPARFFGTPWSFNAGLIGPSVARLAEAEGRAEGFAGMRELLPRLKSIVALSNSSQVAQSAVDGNSADTSFEAVLASVIAEFAKDCCDSGLLRDVAGLLSADLSANAPELATLLRALADFDDASNPNAMLARADPDLATWLKRMRDVPEAEGKLKTKRSAKAAAKLRKKR